jgi:hypothetical protein
MNERQEFAQGLRDMADWYEVHPEITLPFKEFMNYTMNTKEDAQIVMRAMGSCVKTYDDSIFGLEKHFGPIKARFVFMRNEVCERKVVGTKIVPEKFTPAKTEPEHEVEIVEWECVPILKIIEHVDGPDGLGIGSTANE